MSAPVESARLKLLNNEQPNPSDPSPPLFTAARSPPSTRPRHRPGYARVPSVSVVEERNDTGTTDAQEQDNVIQFPRDSVRGHGLGIGYGPDSPSRIHHVSGQSLPRVAVGAGSTPEQQRLDAGDQLVSPPSTGGISGSTRFVDSPGDLDTSHGGAKYVSSLRSSIQPSSYTRSDTELVSVRSRYDDWEPHNNCRSQKREKVKVGTWKSIIIFILAAFSTLFSAAFLIIALKGPRYGRMIHTNGPLTASSAAFLTSFMAKLIELSYVTVLVAFLGQALARRAFRQETARGVTLAELSMRNWIMQPGTILTHWTSVRYAGVTTLGLVALCGAFAALMYTTAATALVQPQLKWPHWQDQVMVGLVKTQFANPDYIGKNCKTPIQPLYDPDNYDLTCLQLEHAAMGYHNYFGYLGTWTDTVNNGTGTTDLSQRPKGFALLNDNTTITAPWIEQTNVTELYAEHNYIINNISMAMPHPGIISAAIDSKNHIMQPSDLGGLGTYNIRASIPSPVVHVLCVTMNASQLKPFVYELWEGVSKPVNMTEWPGQLSYSDPYLNGTIFDNIFKWGPDYGINKWPPVFGKLPIDYNTLVNDTTDIPWGRDSIYVLGKGGAADTIGEDVEATDYALCQLKVSQSPNCSTTYIASASGATLEAVCEDPDDDLAYIRSLTNATSGNVSISQDWPNIASEWARSLALPDGSYDGNSSNARLLTQFILTLPTLNMALPSMAEALAVMAGCTLLQSATDAPLVEFWNYSLASLTPGQYQSFNASIRAQQYASGGTQGYQNAFYLVLFAVFIMNVAALVYFAVHREWYTDFSEPTNLFSLAVNSPPSKEFAGSCGGGPEGEQLKVSWKLNSDTDHVYLESQEVEDAAISPRVRRRRLSQGFDMMMSPLRKATETFDRKMSSL